ncbi:phage baseplate assembly protein V [Aquimarina algiphila]|uniref:Gp5/Type VI secretion system Vgr protein OB-fold domain-containing protein n=1 Tax=Aquimarina algiphila TaxID=2047982 RepID=A0A554VJ67_9FLAO|nr:phage baseplate assembly protein V [Aquimarina algiphila]TSE07886.1 hypothetical protein FOF46_14260 [Aquimarina algiphila]
MVVKNVYEILIGNHQIKSINEFSLLEKAGEHSIFRLSTSYAEIEKTFTSLSPFLGINRAINNSIRVKMDSTGSSKGYSSFEFKGIINAMDISKGYLSPGDIISIQGYGSSILLDTISKFRSFENLKLSSIIRKSIEGYNRDKLNVKLSPEFNDSIPYCVQYGENAFQFIQRQAINRNEFLIYNTDTLYFGKLKSRADIRLNYSGSLLHFNFSTRSPKPENEINNPIQQVHSEYEKINDNNHIKIVGASTNHDISIGRIVDIKNGHSSYGKYRVIQVQHIIRPDGEYYNHFIAVGADSDFYIDTEKPRICTDGFQWATVVDNKDPKGHDRIKVQFEWQKESKQSTPWLEPPLPLTTNSKIKKSVFSIGKKVLINFERNDPEKPFIYPFVYNNADLKQEKIELTNS